MPSHPTYDELVNALASLAEQADQDCPAEYRSRHFKTALEDAFALVNRVAR